MNYLDNLMNKLLVNVLGLYMIIAIRFF